MTRVSSFLKIPKDRVGVLIGPEGIVKQKIQNQLAVELQIESDTGGVTITLSDKASDPSSLMRAKDVVRAIGTGFSPENAFRLIRSEETTLDIIDLRRIFGKSDSNIKRVKGRVIGMNGKTRRTIEELTDTSIAIHGHTISFIGDFEEVEVAKVAVKMLINGSLHRNAYRYLQKKRRELRKKRLELWNSPLEEGQL